MGSVGWQKQDHRRGAEEKHHSPKAQIRQHECSFIFRPVDLGLVEASPIDGKTNGKEYQPRTSQDGARVPLVDLVEGAGLNELSSRDVKGCDNRCGHADSWPMIHNLNS